VVLHAAGIQGELAHCGCRGGLGGLGRRAAAIAAVRREGKPVFQLDAGDAFLRAPPGTAAARPDAAARALAMAGWLGRMGLDLQAPGTRDLHLGWPALARVLEGAGIGLVAANLELGDSGSPATPAFRVLERQGFRLGVVGAAAADAEIPAAARSLTVLPAQGPVQRAVDAARTAGAQVVVLLSHLGFSADLALLAEVKGIDVVVGGRTGERFERPMLLHGVPLVQSGPRGKYLGRLDLRLDAGRVQVEHRLIPLAEEVGEDPTVSAEVAAYLRGLDQSRAGR
jgi:2',3'-cyclic-nucleotide 2'-phosphodiesterase (5'-nucleotidase family)